MSAAGTSHWASTADHWDAIGPPLRPSPDEVDLLRRTATELSMDRRRVLVLGATRELGAASWPDGTSLLAIDRSAPMLGRLWSGPASTAALGDWRALPVADASVDLVACDGGWHLLDRPAGQEHLAAEVGRVVAPGGRVTVRLFEPAPGTVSSDDVLALLEAGEVVDANHLKVLLWMVVRDRRDRVAVVDAWQALVAAFPDLDGLADRLGWPRPTLRAFEAYGGSTDRYDLLDGQELDRQLEAQGLVRVACYAGPMLTPGLSFPTIVYERAS